MCVRWPTSEQRLYGKPEIARLRSARTSVQRLDLAQLLKQTVAALTGRSAHRKIANAPFRADPRLPSMHFHA
jgi:hypothetical protein